MEVVHLNYPDSDGLIYCHLNRDIRLLDQLHVEHECIERACPYLQGSVEGKGIACEYKNLSADEYELEIHDPFGHYLLLWKVPYIQSSVPDSFHTTRNVRSRSPIQLSPVKRRRPAVPHPQQMTLFDTLGASPVDESPQS